MNIAEQIMRAKTDYDAVYEAGKQAGGDFLKEFLQDGKRTNYTYLINGYYWTADTFNPPMEYLPIKPVAASGIFYRATNLELDISKMFDFSECTSLSNGFFESGITKVGVISTEKFSNVHLNYVFVNARNLKTIEKIKVTSDVRYTSAFDNCINLEEVTFEGVIGNDIKFQHSPLNAQSLVSVVEHLSGTATGRTAIFKQSAIDNAEWSTTPKYADWDVLKATKKNWTFKNENGTLI